MISRENCKIFNRSDTRYFKVQRYVSDIVLSIRAQIYYQIAPWQGFQFLINFRQISENVSDSCCFSSIKVIWNDACGSQNFEMQKCLQEVILNCDVRETKQKFNETLLNPEIELYIAQEFFYCMNVMKQSLIMMKNRFARKCDNFEKEIYTI